MREAMHRCQGGEPFGPKASAARCGPTHLVAIGSPARFTTPLASAIARAQSLGPTTETPPYGSFALAEDGERVSTSTLYPSAESLALSLLPTRPVPPGERVRVRRWASNRSGARDKHPQTKWIPPVIAMVP